MFVSDYSKHLASAENHSPDPLRIERQGSSRDTALFPAETLTWRIVAMGERIFAGVLLLLLSPALAIIAAVTVALSRRCPFVAHCRVGQSGKTVWVLKLRTMWDGTASSRPALVEKLPLDVPQNLVPKIAKDPRVKSRFAATCRRYSVDELPQLWHVIRGEMALIGPRPLTWSEIHRYYGSAADEFLAQRPGISGLWQVRGRSRLTYRQRRRLDLFMIRQWSLRLYLRILFATVPAVLVGRNAW
ncbi:MAG: sugar transferase [Acidobacteriaceae bacterium]|nr:sugar transferase [Acidobacteriaceae bacterium]